MNIQKKVNLLILWLVFLSLVYVTAFTYSLDTAAPLGSQAPSVIDDYFRNDKSAWTERLNVDHFFDLTGTEVSDAATGQHRQVEFYGPISTPTNAANKGWLYTKDFSDKVELTWEDEDGNEIQLTSAGKIKKTSIEDYAANLLNPPGVVTCFAGSTAPTGWFLCNGQAVSRTTYASLFAVVSTTYGVGNGTTTFNVPDMVGYFVRGLDIAAAVDPDARTLGSTQAHGIVAHRHRVKTDDYGDSSGSAYVGRGNAGLVDGANVINTTGPYNTAVSEYIGLTETRPVNIALNYIIKY